jgi:hypothetical protein
VSGVHPDTGELFILVEPQAGGWGAGATRDGQNALVCLGDGETYVIPVEVCETRYGVLVDQFALNISDGGAGRYRGGRGLIRDYRITAEEAFITGTFGRFKYWPWGMKNGQNGSPNYMEMIHADGTSKVFGKTAQYRLRRGEVARMVTGTGGGYGDPFKRPDEQIVEDVRNGYITPEMAERDYGINIDPRTGSVKNVRSRNERREPTSTPDLRPGEKTEAVLGILRGQTSASAVAIRFNVEHAEVERWVDDFLKAGEGGLHPGNGSAGSEINELRAMVRELADELSSLRRSLTDRR